MNRHRIRGYKSKNNSVVELEEKNTTDENYSIFDSAVLIAFVTAVGYLLAYSYKKGYLSYYGVPENVISQVDIISIITAISSIFAVLILPYAMYINFKNAFYGVTNPVAIIFKNQIVPLIILWTFMVSIFSDFILYWSIGFVIWGLWFFIIPLVTFRHIQGYKNKLQKFAEKDRTQSFSVKNIIRVLKSKSLTKYIFLLILTFGLSNIVTLIGTAQAKKEREYIKIELENQSYLVIESVGDNYVITPFDEKTNSISDEFSMVEIKSSTDNLMIFQKVKFKEALKIE